jgi:hypothetical protein
MLLSMVIFWKKENFLSSICHGFLVCWSLTASRCDCRPCLWWPVSSVVAGKVVVAIGTKTEKKIKIKINNKKKKPGDLIVLLKR